MKTSIPKLLVLAVLSCFVSSGTAVWADDGSDDSACNGFFYRSKQDGVPMFEEPDSTSRVIKKLQLGEEVCYVGEKADYAIIERKKKSEEKKKPGVAFVRLVDLWEPKGRKTPPRTSLGLMGIWQRAKAQVQFMLNGGVPEDPLAPYRPLMAPFSSPADEFEDKANREVSP